MAHDGTRGWIVSQLERNAIDPSACSLAGGHHEDRYHLDIRAGGWTVYFVERGQEVDPRTHTSRADAESDLLERLLRDPTTRKR